MRSLDDARINKNWNKFLRYVDRRITGLQTGIPSIDRYLLGLGNFVSIQGETSSGKSTFALQIVHYNIAQGNPCIVIEKENGEGRFRSRLICQKNQISESDLMVASHEEKRAFAQSVAGYPLHIYTETVSDIPLLEQRIAECWEKYQKPVLLLLDSAQALDPVADDDRKSLETWVYSMDRLKVKYDGNLTIFMVSEMNRVSYGQEKMGGAKGSNALDFKPETVLSLAHIEDTQKTFLKILKHRDGLKGGKFELEKALADPTNQRSFTFTFREVGDVGI